MHRHGRFGGRWALAMVIAGVAGACGQATPEATDAGTTTNGSKESPAVCDAECPSVTNKRGSTTRTLALTARGGHRTFMVDGAEVTVAVSTYNDSLPGPTVELETPAPGAGGAGDLLILDVSNGGALNTCCWKECVLPRPGSKDYCREPYCRGTGLEEGDACIQVDTPTNIHTHGFHMAAASLEYGPGDPCEFTRADPEDPDLPWDNVYVTIPASGTAEQLACESHATCVLETNRQRFLYPLAPQEETSIFQPEPVTAPHWFGLQWYHPHAHEVSRDQVSRGLAGAIIVRNAAETEIPVLAKIARDSERVMVLQALPLDNDASPREYLRVLNGQVRPRFTVKRGETQRWRVLNADSDHMLQWSVVGANSQTVQYYPIGHDGLPRPSIGPAIESTWIGPGSRLEVLITPPAAAAVGDTFDLVWCQSSTDLFHSPTDTIAANSECTGVRTIVGTLEVVEGAGNDVSFAPGDPFARLADFGLVPDLWAAENADVTRTIKFTQNFDAETGTTFAVDIGDGVGDRRFSHEQVCHAVLESRIGVVEEWVIENWTTDLHTFHLHVNPFQVAVADQDPKLGGGVYYQDNVILPLGQSANDPTNPNVAKSPGVLRIRFRNTDYVGSSVFHCHVLEHEDYGMMATMTVRP